MEHLYSHKVYHPDVSKSYWEYNFFYLKPQLRTFRLIEPVKKEKYYQIHLPHIYCLTRSLYSNGIFIHMEFRFGGSIDRIKSIEQNVFLVPLPHVVCGGWICVSDMDILADSIEKLHEEVFNAFFLNAGYMPWIPYSAGIGERNLFQHMQDNTPGMWESWSKNKDVHIQLHGLLTPFDTTQLDDILQKHAQEG